MNPSPAEMTRLLRLATEGDPSARDRAFEIAYDELRRVAEAMLRSERPGHTLQATALVNEAAIRLLGQRVEWRDRSHFFAVGANAMRRILVDHARAHHARKRGGGRRRVELSGGLATTAEIDLDALITLDDLLARLERLDERKSRVVELRYFAGLEDAQIAEVLGIARSTVSADWAFARAWLSVRLGESEAAGG